ncbi:4'-phosphopantetheinyl transferase superfamily protein [Patescibacteria group bacterium]|nr:4'-phosphopantetheinyl transferase superfamily protein [Patescibacteria group bacterium]
MILSLTTCTEDSREALRIAGRRAARRALQHAAASPLVEIKRETTGKPYGVRRDCARPIALSISHAYPYALAFASTKSRLLGVDVERIRSFSPRIENVFLTPSELNWIKAHSLESRDIWRTLLWSMKEAVIKAIGTGLRTHPARVDLTPILSGSSAICIHGYRLPATVYAARVGSTHWMAAIALPPFGRYTLS